MVDNIQWPAWQKQLQFDHKVYVKQNWEDDWTEVKDMFALELSWSAAPSMSTARLDFRYGRAMRANDDEPGIWRFIQESDHQDYYVKVEVETHEFPGPDPAGNLVWYGIIKIDVNELGAVLPGIILDTSGHQVFEAYGMEYLLERTKVNSSTIRDGFNNLTLTDVARGITFNTDNEGNKAADQLAFAAFSSEKEDWSSRDIIKYLADQSPKNSGGNTKVKFEIDSNKISVVPDSDKPVLPSHMRTVRELLNQVLHRGRLLGYYVTVDESGDESKCVIRPFSYAKSNITLPGGGSLKANEDQVSIDFEDDPDVMATLKTTTVNAFDCVRVWGARRRSCFTVGFQDGSLESGWPSDLEEEYEKGASEQPDYPAASEIEERRQLDATVRASERLETVYSRFQIPEVWNLKAGDGTGNVNEFLPITPQDDDTLTAYPLFNCELVLLPTLPLLDGKDYENFGSIVDIEKFSLGPHKEIPPLVFLKDPDDEDEEKYIQLNRHAQAEFPRKTKEKKNRLLTGHVFVVPDDRAFFVHVHGQPQHAIAFLDFEKLSHDEQVGEYEWKDMVATVAIEDDRHAVGQWPADNNLPNGTDAILYLDLDAGEDFKLDYLVPNTVVGLNPYKHTLVTNAAGGRIRDDTKQLKDRARAAFEYYGKSRAVLSFETRRITNHVQLGQFVTEIGNEDNKTINSVVTEIKMDFGVAEDGDAPPNVLRYTTAYGELDVLSI